MNKLGPVTYSVDIENRRTIKQHIDQLRHSVHRSPESTSNTIDDYHYYEPVTPVQDVDPVPQTHLPKPLEEEQRNPHDSIVSQKGSSTRTI